MSSSCKKGHVGTQSLKQIEDEFMVGLIMTLGRSIFSLLTGNYKVWTKL